MASHTPAERVASNVRAEMARGKRTQADLGRALGLTRSAVHRRLTGALALDIDELHRIADFLSVPINTLLGADTAATAGPGR